MLFWQKSLQARLVTYFLAVSILTISLVGLVAQIQAGSALEASIFDRLEAVAILKEETLSRWLADRRSDINLLARSPEIYEATPLLVKPAAGTPSLSVSAQDQSTEELDRFLTDVVRRGPDLNAIFIIEPTDGRVIYATDNTAEVDRGEMATLSDLLQNPSVQTISLETGNVPATVIVASPIRTGEGQTVGVLVADFDLAHVENLMHDQAGLGELGATFLVGPDSLFLPATSDASVAQNDLPSPFASAGISAVLAGATGAGRYENHEGIPVLGVYRWLDELQLGLIAELPEAEAFAPVRRLGLSIALAGLGGAILLAIVIYFVSRSISRPIEEVTETAVRIANGNLSATVAVRTQDEIGILAAAFNEMTEQLRQLYMSLEAQVDGRTAELAASVQQLNLINQVGRSANSLLTVEDLLPEVVRLIRESFGFYAVGILLIDRRREIAYLAATDTVSNPRPTYEKLAVNLSEPSIIAKVATSGKPIVANDVSQTDFFPLQARSPNVKSELGLPLISGEDVFGVLEIQHSEVGAFSPEDVQVLQTLSDQIAVAIRNAELFAYAEDARTDAEEANWLKTQFMANMSHELRTPLNAIINFAYLLSLRLDGPLTDEQADMLNRIGDSGRDLLGLINDILDLAKIESGRLELVLEETHLQELVQGVMSTAGGLVREKPIELISDLPDDLPAAEADKNRVRQVLLNLVANAAKFTDAGIIALRAKADHQWLTVSVEDTGIGMRAQDIPKAFADFIQLDGDRAQRRSGTGLGLPISRRFIEMHGGIMWVESTVGRGSTFYFTLPRYQAGQLPSNSEIPSQEVSLLEIIEQSKPYA